MAVHEVPMDTFEVRTVGQREPTPKELALMRAAYRTFNNIPDPRAFDAMSPDDMDLWFRTIVAVMRELDGTGKVWPAEVAEAMRAAWDDNTLRHGMTETLFATFNAGIRAYSPKVAGID